MWLLLGALLTVITMFVGTSTSAGAAAPTISGLTAPINTTFVDSTGATQTFTGTYTLNRVTTQSGALAAVGTVTGTVTNAAGTVLQTVNQVVTTPLQATGSCQILHLTLGPLDLNLLGLVVHLDQVVLDISAQSGPGNLLGNLLCGIANLLNGSAPASTLATLLNRLLALL
jgi:hypothetical protein